MVKMSGTLEITRDSDVISSSEETFSEEGVMKSVLCKMYPIDWTHSILRILV